MTTTADLVLAKLQAFDLKPDGKNQWRCNSPLRLGANSHSFRVLINDGEHGAYDDKVSQESGSLYQLAQALGIETPHADGTGRTDVASTKRAYQNLQEYAEAHGLDGADLKAAAWSEVEQVYDYVAKRNRPALQFKTKTGSRWRFIDGDKEHAVYKSELHYKECWYGLTKAMQKAKDLDSPLILCNGEISTLAGQKYGLPAFCKTGGERKLPQALVDELNGVWDGPIWICYDCDDTGRRAASDVAGQLGTRAVVIDLNLGNTGDLADFAMIYQDKALEQLSKRAEKSKPVESQMSDEQLLSETLRQLAQAVREGDARSASKEALVAQARAQLDRLSMNLARPTVRSFKELVTEERRKAQEQVAFAEDDGGDFIPHLRTNFPIIDKIMWGVSPELYGILGATGMGKSFFLASLGREFVKQGAIFIVSTEMQPGRWLRRLTASIARVPESCIRHGVYKSRDDLRRVLETFDLLEQMNCHFLDHSSPTPNLVRSAVLDGLNAGYAYEAILVDSATKMTYPGTGDSVFNRVVGVWDGLQDLYRETQLPVIASSQLGRDVADRPAGKKQPQLDDAFGGSVIEHNSGVVIGLYYHHYYVKRGLEDPRDDLPEGVFQARFLKLRDEDDSEAPAVRLTLLGGAGMYPYEAVNIDLNTGEKLRVSA